MSMRNGARKIVTFCRAYNVVSTQNVVEFCCKLSHGVGRGENEEKKIINIRRQWIKLNWGWNCELLWLFSPFRCCSLVHSTPHHHHREVANVNIWLDFCAARKEDEEFWAYMKITNFLERKMEWKKKFFFSFAYNIEWCGIWVKLSLNEELVWKWMEKFSSMMWCDVCGV